MGHYGFMAAFSVSVIGAGLLASPRPDGWRLTAWVTGLLPSLLALTSLIYPVSSSLSLPWAVAASGWGIGFSEQPSSPAPAVEAACLPLHTDGVAPVGDVVATPR